MRREASSLSLRIFSDIDGEIATVGGSNATFRSRRDDAVPTALLDDDGAHPDARRQAARAGLRRQEQAAEHGELHAVLEEERVARVGEAAEEQRVLAVERERGAGDGEAERARADHLGRV